MNQTVPVTVKKCKRCNGRIVQSDEPYCLSCGHRPEGFRISASDAGPLVMFRQGKRETCPRGHVFTVLNTITRSDGRRCRECLREANRRYRVRTSKAGVA